MNGVWLATMVTEHYEWTTIGKTKDEAIKTIIKEWQHGSRHEDRTKMTRKELEDYYGIYCRFIEFGQCEWN